jgi:UDP-N-acetylglucosamine acyltransferase
MSDIHETAIIHQKAVIGKNVKIGPFTVIDENVEIGDGTVIGPSAHVTGWTKIGERCKIFHGASLGNCPQHVDFKGEKSFLNIGKQNIIREFVTIHRATSENQSTVIGDNNFIMAYVHIAHNCKIGNHTIITNGSQLAGFVEVEDFAFISGLCPVHQFVRIGAHSMIGGGYRVPKDVPPYALVAGNPLRVYGLNIVGLRRHGFDDETIKVLKQAFKIIFFSSFNTTQAIREVRRSTLLTDEVKHIIEFIEKSKRGIIK